ncbi:hypothetical protein Tco_0018939 [Tanacetum coccineum]
MQSARDRQKSYADLKRKPMEFQVGDRVMLKVSPWKGVVHFGKRGKLNPRYVGPFKVMEKKCYSDETLAVPLEGLHVDDKLRFVEEPVEIIDREVKRLNQSRILIVKVTMPQITGLDHQNTRNYIPLISNEFEQPLQNTIATLEKWHFHEGMVTRSDHGTKRRSDSNPSSSSTALNHSSSSHHLDENVDDNDEESSHSSTPSLPQLISSLSNVVPRVFENLSHESQSLNSYQTEIINHQIQHREELQKGLRSIGKALKDMMKGKNK